MAVISWYPHRKAPSMLIPWYSKLAKNQESEGTGKAIFAPYKSGGRHNATRRAHRCLALPPTAHYRLCRRILYSGTTRPAATSKKLMASAAKSTEENGYSL